MCEPSWDKNAAGIACDSLFMRTRIVLHRTSSPRRGEDVVGWAISGYVCVTYLLLPCMQRLGDGRCVLKRLLQIIAYGLFGIMNAFHQEFAGEFALSLL